MITQCQNCKKLLNIPDAYEGKKIKCPNCNRPFQAFPEIEKEPVKQTELPTTLTPQSNAIQIPLPSKSVKLETPLSEPSILQERGVKKSTSGPFLFFLGLIVVALVANHFDYFKSIVESVVPQPRLSETDKQLIRNALHEAEVLYHVDWYNKHVLEDRKIQFAATLKALDELKRYGRSPEITVLRLQQTGLGMTQYISLTRLTTGTKSAEYRAQAYVAYKEFTESAKILLTKGYKGALEDFFKRVRQKEMENTK